MPRHRHRARVPRAAVAVAASARDRHSRSRQYRVRARARRRGADEPTAAHDTRHAAAPSRRRPHDLPAQPARHPQQHQARRDEHEQHQRADEQQPRRCCDRRRAVGRRGGTAGDGRVRSRPGRCTGAGRSTRLRAGGAASCVRARCTLPRGIAGTRPGVRDGRSAAPGCVTAGCCAGVEAGAWLGVDTGSVRVTGDVVVLRVRLRRGRRVGRRRGRRRRGRGLLRAGPAACAAVIGPAADVAATAAIRLMRGHRAMGHGN